jgi:hypothetical protein
LIVLAVLMLPTAVVVDFVSGPSRSPVETVRRYLEAVRAGEVDEALGYLRVDVVPDSAPAGSESAMDWAFAIGPGPSAISETASSFLHPEAVSADWEVLNIRQGAIELGNTGYEYTDLVSVEVVFGDGEGTASGELLVPEEDPDWIINGLVPVTLTYGANTFVRANDRVVEREVRHTVICCEDYPPDPTGFAMFPGVYEFGSAAAEGEPVALMPGAEEPAFIPVGAPEAEADSVATVQEAVDEYIDECVEFGATRGVQYCPFASDGEVDSEEHGRVYLEDVAPARWEVVEYPTVTIEAEQDRYGLRAGIVVEEPGLLRLSATGESQDGESVDFTALCHFDTEYLTAYFNSDGSAEIRWYESIRDPDFQAYDGYGPDSCRGTTG